MSRESRSVSRRALIRYGAAAAALSAVRLPNLAAQATRFQLGACDWSLGRRANLEALSVAKQLGLDGVQVSMGGLDKDRGADYDLHLRRADVRRTYREAAAANGVRIGGVALDIMNQIPFKSDPRTEQWVSDSIDAARDLQVRVVLLAFFVNGDLRNDPDGQAETIRRLKRVAPKAEQHGVVLGIESWLSAADHLRIIEAIGSPNVQVYYDLANSTQMGYDVLSEIRQLGRARICEFHAKENGFLLGQGRIDFPAVRRAMDDIGYTGWIQIEGAVPEGQPLVQSHMQNVRFMRTHFS